MGVDVVWWTPRQGWDTAPPGNYAAKHNSGITGLRGTAWEAAPRAPTKSCTTLTVHKCYFGWPCSLSQPHSNPTALSEDGCSAFKNVIKSDKSQYNRRKTSTRHISMWWWYIFVKSWAFNSKSNKAIWQIYIYHSDIDQHKLGSENTKKTTLNKINFEIFSLFFRFIFS